MDQDEFRRTYDEVNKRKCAFEKAILTNQCECRHSERFCIAEREGLRCHSDEGNHYCFEWLNWVRDQSRFIIQETDSAEKRWVLAHGKAIRIQVGGLRGLYLNYHPDQTDPPNPIPDVFSLTSRWNDDSPEALDLNIIIRQINAFQGRKRSRRKNKKT